jgi:transglutaminase-like putative cysteine protease
LRTVKPALLALLPAVLIATGWQGLEQPARGAHFSLAAMLGIVIALVPRRWIRILAEVAGFVVVASIGFGLSPFDARPFDGQHDFFGPVLSRFGNGVIDFYEVALPFDPREQQRMHGAIVLAVFAFTLLAALAVVARRPVLAAATTFAGAAWPVTLIADRASTARGVVLLVAALLLLAALRPTAGRGTGQALLVGATVAVAALVAVSSPSVAKGGFLDWQRWEPYLRSAPPVSVQYVWDSDYDGIDFPKKATTVLKVSAPRRSPYWRATTLDVFLDDHWREESSTLDPVRVGSRDALISDPYLPPQARQPENWMRQVVNVEALRDTHLAAASVPVAFEAGAAGYYGSGTAYVGRLHRGQDYTAWSYVGQPTPSDLAESKARYDDIRFYPFLTVDAGVALPPFRAPNRDRLIDELFSFDSELGQYEPLYRQARRVVGNPRNPYAAVVALEAWFRTGGDFTYDEHPPIRLNRPPLVAFATGHKRGYCQHFAGAMALMLRYLGIPARVAVGFTTGRWDPERGEWTVADTNAHAWVEVWFDGWGWLPFDPTPGRGRLRGSYTASSLFFDANGATNALIGVAASALGLTVLRSHVTATNQSPDDRVRGADPGTAADRAGTTAAPTPTDDRNDIALLGILLLAACGLLTALWLAKTARRRIRYLSDDPRRISAAVRSELVDYLADQGIRMAPSATPADVGRSVRENLLVDADRLAGALGTARFGPSDEAEDAARVARRELKRVLKAVRQRLGARAKLRGLVSLRSLRLRSA